MTRDRIGKGRGRKSLEGAPFGVGKIRRDLDRDAVGDPEVCEEIIGPADQGGAFPDELERCFR